MDGMRGASRPLQVFLLVLTLSTALIVQSALLPHIAPGGQAVQAQALGPKGPSFD
jgi:hypothetical protein